MKGKTIAIIGAGLVGTVAALYFSRLGCQVSLYERRSDPRLQKQVERRSINLALSHRGIRALTELGLAEEVLANTVPVYGRCVHVNGEIDYQKYSHHKNEYNYSISRSGLNAILLNRVAAEVTINLHFNCDVIDLKTRNEEIIIAADGASSHLRRNLHKQGTIDFSECYSDHAYKELLLEKQFSKELNKNYLHIWPKHQYMFMALPNLDGSFTCTLFMPQTIFSTLKTAPDIERFFKENFPEVCLVIPDYLQQFQKNKTSRLKTVQGSPWWVEDKVLFIGDAAHAMLPYLGQGMNCGFEDCRILNDTILAQQDIIEGIRQFATSRKKDTDAISELSLRNYHEMCHKVIDKDYLAKRKKEAEQAENDPSGFRSIYELISYTSTPYHQILQKIL